MDNVYSENECRKYLLSLPKTKEDFPFAANVYVFKVKNKTTNFVTKIVYLAIHFYSAFIDGK